MSVWSTELARQEEMILGLYADRKAMAERLARLEQAVLELSRKPEIEHSANGAVEELRAVGA